MKHQRGFSLVTAIFILVVVGLLGSYLAQMSSVGMRTTSYAVQGVRAYLAARAGLEWAMVRLSGGGTCTNVNGQSYNLDGFTVSLTCTSQAFTEGARNYTVYTVNSLSQFGSYGSEGYVARGAKVTFIQ